MEDKRMVVRGLHTQRVHIRLTVIDGFRILDWEQIVCIAASGSRIKSARDRIQEIS